MSLMEEIDRGLWPFVRTQRLHSSCKPCRDRTLVATCSETTEGMPAYAGLFTCDCREANTPCVFRSTSLASLTKASRRFVSVLLAAASALSRLRLSAGDSSASSSLTPSFLPFFFFDFFGFLAFLDLDFFFFFFLSEEDEELLELLGLDEDLSAASDSASSPSARCKKSVDEELPDVCCPLIPQTTHMTMKRNRAPPFSLKQRRHGGAALRGSRVTCP